MARQIRHCVMFDGGLIAEDGSVVCRTGRYFGRIARPNKKISAAENAAQVKAGSGDRAGEENRRSKEGGRERERERERERRAKLAELSGGKGTDVGPTSWFTCFVLVGCFGHTNMRVKTRKWGSY